MLDDEEETTLLEDAPEDALEEALDDTLDETLDEMLEDEATLDEEDADDGTADDDEDATTEDDDDGRDGRHRDATALPVHDRPTVKRKRPFMVRVRSWHKKIQTDDECRAR